MRKLITTLLAGVVCLNAYSQCGPATVSVVNYCPDQYAEFTITDPDPNTKYQWFADAAGTVPLGYGPGGTDGKYFVSPTTYPTGSGTQTFYYQREIEGVTGGPPIASSTGQGLYNGPVQGLYNLPYTSTADFELTEVTILIYQNGMDQAWYNNTHRLQIELDGNFANFHYFDKNDVTKIFGDYYAVTIPIDRDGLGNGLLGGTGTNTIAANGSAGGGAVATTLAFVNSGAIANSYTIGSGGSTITIDQDGNDQNGWWGNARPAIFDWNVNFYCPLESVSAIEETNAANCCTPVAIQPVVTSQSGDYVFQSPFSENLVAGSSNPAHYFRWFLNGSPVAEGYGMDTYAATATGNYEVRVVEDQADVNRLSCYNESSLINLEEKILFAVASSTNICIGDPLTLEAQGALSNIQWTPAAGNITSPTSATTTANPTQTTTYTVTAEVPSGNLAQNWDFEQGNVLFDVSAGMRNAPATDITYGNDWSGLPNDPGPHPILDFANYGSNGNGVYAVIDTYVSQGGWALAYDCGDHTTGNGNFFLHDAMENTTMSTYGVTNDLDAYIWKQDVIVSANTAYDFSAWFANAEIGGYNNPPQIQMYVNDVPILGTPWQQAGNATEWGTCDWHEVLGTWNSGSYSGPAEIKIVELSHAGSGNDFLMDDVMFSSGTSIQSDDVTINVTDCFTITAQQNTNCVNDSSEIEIVTGGLFLGWNELGGGTTSIKDPAAEVTLVSPPADTRYVGCAQFPMGNLLTNGDFELGNQGFTSDYTVGNSGGQYQITTNANTMNGTWFINNTDNTTGTGNMMVVDGGSNTTQDIWENTVDVVNGQDYAFSVWVQNVHVNMDNPAEMVFMANGMQLGNIDLPDNDQNWIQFFTTWTANTTGTITISIRNDNSGFLGNDFAIDDISFAPLFNETRCDTVDVVACVPPCQPPTALAIDQSGPLNLCAGVNQTLSGTYTLHPTPLDQYYYTWLQDGTPVTGPSTTYSDEILNTIAVADAGTYTLRIEDGNNDDAACYLEDQIVVNVEDQPSTSDAGTAQTQCETTTTATLAGNNPATGTGTWTLVSGSGTITTPTSNTSGVTGLAVGANTFRWTISTGTFCTDETDDVVITLDAAPTASAAGTDQTICGTGSTENLSANIPTVGTGTWSTTAGTGTFGNANNASTTVSGLSLGANTFTWTISEPGLCPDATDDITITVETPPSAAVAGINDTICETPGTTTLGATAPANGTGTWTGGTFSNANDPSATVSGLSIGDNTLTWTVSTGGTCPDEVDQVNVTIDAAPSTANAGTNQNICDGDVLTLAATAPASGSGVWSLVAGGGTFTTDTDPASTVTGYNSGTNTYRWTVSNGVCPDETADVDVNVDDQPTVASVGPDLNVCIADPINLTGNNPSVGTGVWTTGPATTGGTIDNTAQFNSSVSGMAGSDVLEAIWTISNGVCPASDDTITITATGIAAPSVTLNVSQAQVCEGTSITFTASGNNGGSSPTYQFFDQNNNPLTTATATNTYTIAAPTQDTIVYVELVSNSSCLGANPANVSSSNVPVQVDLNPSTAVAGPDQTICTAQATLAATAPAIGTGTWTVTSGTGSVTTINDPASTITGLVISSTATVQWEVSNGVCPSTTDDVDITRTGDLTTPNAGTDQTICEDATATLAGNTPNGADVGTWTTSGDGSFTPDANTPAAVYTPGNNDIMAGTATLTWTMSNGICPDAGDDVIITVDSLPSTADAGTDQTLCTDQTTLAAVAPTTGTGMWSTVSGSGSVTTPASEISTVTGLTQGTTLTLQWEVSNGVCPSSTDQVDITRTGALTTPNAGPDQTICESSSATLNANTPQVGESGTWTTSGDGTFDDATSPTAVYTLGTETGSVTLTWTIDNGGLCPAANDDVVITLDPLPTVADAGPARTICTSDFTLEGNPATTGTGMWTTVTGPGTYADPTDENTLVSNLQDGTNQLQWTISSGACPASSDVVTITKSGDLTSPSAGTDDNICETQTSYTLSGNGANAGNGETGTWTVIAGTATITSPNNPTTDITAMGVGTITMRWTIDNGGVCPDAFDEVNIVVDQDPGTITLDPDTNLCGTSMPLNGTTPVVGTGVWAITGGPGTVTTPTDPSSTITGLSGLTELTWVVTNGTCVQGDAFRITASLPQTPDVILAPSNSSICEGDPITFTATPVGSGNGANPTYEFYENGMSVQGPTTIASYTPLNYTAATGNITVVIRPSITCVDVDSAVDLANANVSSAPFVSIVEPDAQVCITNGYTLTAVTSANTSLQWYDVSSGGPVALFGENSTTLDVPNTGDYIAVVNNNDLSCNAESSDTVEVIIDAMPNVEAGDEQTLFVGESITMTGSVSNAAGGSIWTVDAGEFADATNPTSQYTGLIGGQQFYTLTATNGACTNSDGVIINVRVPIKVPNAFTPNADNLNDVLNIEGLDTYEDVVLEIFNRWGSPVYKSVGTYIPWDGFRGGEAMPVATYYYILTVDGGSEDEQVFNGSVTLVR